jgi:hypothetical protein
VTPSTLALRYELHRGPYCASCDRTGASGCADCVTVDPDEANRHGQRCDGTCGQTLYAAAFLRSGDTLGDDRAYCLHCAAHEIAEACELEDGAQPAAVALLAEHGSEPWTLGQVLSALDYHRVRGSARGLSTVLDGAEPVLTDATVADVWAWLGERGLVPGRAVAV